MGKLICIQSINRWVEEKAQMIDKTCNKKGPKPYEASVLASRTHNTCNTL